MNSIMSVVVQGSIKFEDMFLQPKEMKLHAFALL